MKLLLHQTIFSVFILFFCPFLDFFQELPAQIIFKTEQICSFREIVIIQQKKLDVETIPLAPRSMLQTRRSYTLG